MSARASSLSCGITAPSRNAPNIAWMPIASVVSADDEQRHERQRDSAVGRLGRRGLPCTSRANSGRTTSEHHRDEARRPDTSDRPRAPPASWTTPTTNASRHHAVTSSTAAQVSATTPELRLRHAPVGEDARQHRERGDRHRDAHEQREAGERHVARREARIEVQRQHRAQHERDDDAGVRRWRRSSCTCPRSRSAFSSSPTRNM